jgi:hypothetical protein
MNGDDRGLIQPENMVLVGTVDEGDKPPAWLETRPFSLNLGEI